uniref:Uncharacterized protein n=1 Tax=Acrobeloides nanus TaxID=290746 RepID=A0A914E1I1_9BILA
NVQTDNVQSNTGNWLPIISAILPYLSGPLDRVASALPTILNTGNQNLNNSNVYAGSTRTQRNNDNVQFGNGNIRFGNVVQNEDIEATSRQMQGVYNSGNGRVPMNQCNQFMDHPATRGRKSNFHNSPFIKYAHNNSKKM